MAGTKGATSGTRHLDAHDTEGQSSVAVVGTGLAGLTTAYLLNNDAEKRYKVTLFEQSQLLSFAGASVAVKNAKEDMIEQIDLPMRASAGGYYDNLMRMYHFVGIPLHPIRFLFTFAKATTSNASPKTIPLTPQTAGEATGAYFVHASNLHQLLPPRPESRSLIAYLFEIAYLIICHFWFSVACFVVAPRTGAAAPGGECEDLREYLKRIWLPRRYITHYLLPLMSAVSTCSHAEILRFPASDIVNYKRHSTGQQHYAVCGGADQVQRKLSEGIHDVRLATRVLSVQPVDGKVVLRFQTDDGEATEQAFDRLVLAVSPDVAGRLYSPVESLLQEIPTVYAESSVLTHDVSTHSVIGYGGQGEGALSCAHHSSTGNMPAQVLTFRTLFTGDDSKTEAMHAMPSGVVVSTCPFASECGKGTLHSAGFIRTLRSKHSRSVVQAIMREAQPENGGKEDEETMTWVNGQDNVWLAGAWCWDGMVLLEGCVVSAMRVAQDFGVAIPWQGITVPY
ncbi:hypothetical protein NLG97_g7802 [Lecanicillium saksenae]|uniref:Uncharacterized protein n=1 Tax=Lecanicillium saksenae TaxID=468837 RepID=A0ACC1QLW2_9HYPO|nr:hypothetical protein NLG97_g7802 [Lecanicillium saksenae]